MALRNVKFKLNFWLICQYFILISYEDCTTETRRLMQKVYNNKVIECIL